MRGKLRGYMNNFQDFFSHAVKQFLTLELVDIIDIALVAFMIFFIIRFISDKRAGKLAMGICMVLFLVIISYIFQMNAINFIFSNIMQAGIILIVVLFQAEIRSALEKIGGAGQDLTKLPVSKEHKNSKNKSAVALDTLCKAVQELAQDYTGALIVMERDTPLGDVISKGSYVGADIGVEIIKNIFFNKAPLHDGAMIIRNFRIHSAGCILPLTEKTDINQNLGTRHRAAVGMSENSDAVVIVVSEETGTISLAVDGKLRRNYDYNSLKKTLEKYLYDDNGKKTEEASASAEG